MCPSEEDVADGVPKPAGCWEQVMDSFFGPTSPFKPAEEAVLQSDITIHCLSFDPQRVCVPRSRVAGGRAPCRYALYVVVLTPLVSQSLPLPFVAPEACRRPSSGQPHIPPPPPPAPS